MNHVYWLIYFADMSGSASVACGMIGILASMRDTIKALLKKARD